MGDTILSIDCGTQSLRALLFNSEGELIAKEKIEYEPYYSVKPGRAEQDARIYWRSLCEAALALKNRIPGCFNRIAGVGVSTQRDSMINVDKEGNPLRPVIIWLDQRKAKKVYNPSWPVRLAFRLAGVDEILDKAQTDGKCNWIRQNEPEIWEATHKYLQLSGFLNHCLTDEFRDSVASQIGHIPFNYRKMRWAGRMELPAKLFPIEPWKLPETVEPGSILGHVTDKASVQTGIAQGTPVVACGSDKGCETIGMGVVDETRASLSFGTTATIQTTSDRYYEPLRFMPPYPAAIPARYNPEIEIFRGYWMINWFKEEFGLAEVLEAREKGIAPEIILNQLLERTPPGAMGLVVQPYWNPGLKHLSAKGAMIGFGDVHKKGHVYRAVIEGLGFALFEGLKAMEASGGFKAQRLAVSGGASQSNEICQISADIFNMPLHRGKTFESTGLGAAIVTAVGLGMHESYEEAIEQMVAYDVVFEPNKDNAALYKRMYDRVYSRMYKALAPLYNDIREITGYPEHAG
jgi:sugar (pentulose or hexulose) kinase